MNRRSFVSSCIASLATIPLVGKLFAKPTRWHRMIRCDNPRHRACMETSHLSLKDLHAIRCTHPGFCYEWFRCFRGNEQYFTIHTWSDPRPVNNGWVYVTEKKT